MKLKYCVDCGAEIPPFANHTGCARWCEDCFEKGLSKDMDNHFKNFVDQDLEEFDIEN